MIEAVTQDRWQRAQTAEAGYHDDAANYHRATRTVFAYLGMDIDFRRKSIAEVGCGPYPSVLSCTYSLAVLYEPLPFKTLQDAAKDGQVIWYQQAFEDVPHPPKTDELWLFNCLQHVRDPELLISKAKKSAKIVRFFEPIDFGTSEPHPHTFSIDDFTRWFGEAKRYKGGTAEGFHTADCAYGTWMKK